MTRLTPESRCEVCGGLLTPPVVIPRTTDEPIEAPDYVCIQCGQAYFWKGNPPVLVKVPPA